MVFLCTAEYWADMLQNWRNSWLSDPWLSNLAASVLIGILPIAVVCVLLNRYIFRSADMISGSLQ